MFATLSDWPSVPRVGRARFGAAIIRVFALLLPFATPAFAQSVFFASDGAGIAYESVAPARALRLPWAVELRPLENAQWNESVVTDLPLPVSAELRILYRSGAEHRRSVEYRDGGGVVRVVEITEASGSKRLERYDQKRRLIEESEAEAAGDGIRVAYDWSDDRLARATAHRLDALDALPIWIDRYRYDRSGGLITVEREGGQRFSQRTVLGTPRSVSLESADGGGITLRYDPSGRLREIARSAKDDSVVVETFAYEGEQAPEGGAVSSVLSADGSVRETTFDEQDRPIWEVLFDKDGAAIETVEREWSEDRLILMVRTTVQEIRRFEYEYDAAGVRSVEREYRDGQLERMRTMNGAEEMETLYLDGKPILLSRYRNGIKESEERVR